MNHTILTNTLIEKKEANFHIGTYPSTSYTMQMNDSQTYYLGTIQKCILKFHLENIYRHILSYLHI